MRRRKFPAPLTVETVKNTVVLTMSRPRAHHLAMVLNGARSRETWLDEAAVAVLAAANGPDGRSAELHHRGAWLDASALVSRELLRSSGLMGVAQDIADHVLQFSQGCSVAILVLSPDDPALFEVRIAAGVGAAERVDRTLQKRGSLAGAAVDHDRGELGTIALGESWSAGAASATGRQPVMAAPIHSGGRPCGAILVHRDPGHPAFDATVLTMVEEFARQTSLALELATRRTEHAWRQERVERDRAEHALYDSLLQRLFSIGMTVQGAEAVLRQGEDSPIARQAREHLARAVDDLDAVMRDIRAVLQKGHGQPADGASAAQPQVVEPPLPEPEVAASLVHTAAVQAAERAEAAVETAAHRAAEAASTARDQRSAAVQVAADAVAARVAAAAAAVEDEADIAALTVAQAAFDAALLIASTVAPGSERDAALTATLVATAVSGIAIKTAAVTAAARAAVAQEAAAAAAAAAVAAADAAKIVDLEVLCAAEAVRAVATQAASVLAEQTEAEATAITRAGLTA